MERKYRKAIERANDAIRRNRLKRGLSERDPRLSNDTSIETLSCANAFARSGKNVEHLWDKLF